MAAVRKDIRLEVKVRNNLILTKMEEKGIYTITELCRSLNGENDAIPFVSSIKVKAFQTGVGKLINMKESARNSLGDWTQLALLLSEFFQCMPEDLFSEPQQWSKLEKNRTSAELAYSEMQQLAAQSRASVTPELELQATELRAAINSVLSTLPARHERVLRLRLGFEGDVKTLGEIGKMLGVSQERIRGIESEAMNKLKNPKRRRVILNACGGHVVGKTWSGDDVVAPDEDVIDAL